ARRIMEIRLIWMRVMSRSPWVARVVALSTLTGTSAFAQSASPALERCRETVGRAIVVACMQQGEGSIEKCRAKASPAVRRCMAANGGGIVRKEQESPTPDTGKGTLAILMPGAGGAIASDFLVRNKGRIGGSAVSVVVTTSSGQAASLSQSASEQGRK